jgi:hypothetical protein
MTLYTPIEVLPLNTKRGKLIDIGHVIQYFNNTEPDNKKTSWVFVNKKNRFGSNYKNDLIYIRHTSNHKNNRYIYIPLNTHEKDDTQLFTRFLIRQIATSLNANLSSNLRSMYEYMNQGFLEYKACRFSKGNIKIEFVKNEEKSEFVSEFVILNYYSFPQLTEIKKELNPIEEKLEELNIIIPKNADDKLGIDAEIFELGRERNQILKKCEYSKEYCKNLVTSHQNMILGLDNRKHSGLYITTDKKGQERNFLERIIYKNNTKQINNLIDKKLFEIDKNALNIFES